VSFCSSIRLYDGSGFQMSTTHVFEVSSSFSHVSGLLSAPTVVWSDVSSLGGRALSAGPSSSAFRRAEKTTQYFTITSALQSSRFFAVSFGWRMSIRLQRGCNCVVLVVLVPTLPPPFQLSSPLFVLLLGHCAFYAAFPTTLACLLQSNAHDFMR